MRQTKVLLLGGTSEASDLANRFADDRRFNAILSLAGRTANPKIFPLETRVGGFGGRVGLAGYLLEHAIDVVIDATHPFAAEMSANAIPACREMDIPLLAVERPPWRPEPGDSWQNFPSAEAAVAAIGEEPRRVFCAIGRLSLGALGIAPQHHYVIRLVDAPTEPLEIPNTKLITARGPFRAEDDRALLQSEAIDIVLTKNSGGSAAVAKLIAARDLGIPVFLIDRPAIPDRPSVTTVEEAWTWLIARHECSSADRGA